MKNRFLKESLKIGFSLCLLLSFSTNVFAEMVLFWDKDCSHCQVLNEYLDQKNFVEKFQIQTYEITENKPNEAYYLQKSKEVGYGDLLLPLLIHDENYFDGREQITEYLNTLDSKLQSTQSEQQELTYLSEQEGDLLTSIIEDEKKSQARISANEDNAKQNTSKPNTNYILIFLIPIVAFAAYRLISTSSP